MRPLCWMLTAALVLLTVPAVTAQEASDDASNYGAGNLTQLDQGTGWASGAVNITGGIGGTASVASATSESGSSTMDESSQAWILKPIAPAGSYGYSKVGFERYLGSVLHDSGEQLRFDIQVFPPVTGNVIVYVYASGHSLVQLTISGGTWSITHSGGPTGTTVDVTTPQEVLITNDGSSVTLRFLNLSTMTTETHTVTPSNTGDIDRLAVSATVPAFGDADSATVIMNRMLFSSTGGLPVELESFQVQ